MTVRPLISPSSCSWIAASTSESSAEVASSSTRIGASLRITRASAMRWRWPPDSLTPRSPTWASKPRRPCQSSSPSMKSSACACAAARRISHVARLRPAVADVVADRAVQERGVLRHHRDLGAQALLGDLGDVLAVDQDAAAFEVVEAQQQIDEGRFAGARRPDQADPLARARWRDRSPCSTPRGGAVAETHTLETHAPRSTRSARRPAGPASAAARRSSACPPARRRYSRRSS